MKPLPADLITAIDEAKSLAQGLVAWYVWPDGKNPLDQKEIEIAPAPGPGKCLVWDGVSSITVTMLPTGPFVWSDLFGKRDTTEREAEVSCKVGHARWTDWDLRHDAKCMTCPGETVAKYTGKMREKK